MKFKTTAVLLCAFLLTGCSLIQEIEIKSTLVNPPIATRQLGPAIFLPKNIVYEIVEEEGDVILVSYNNKSIELRCYMFFGKDSTFGMYSEYTKSLGIKYGTKYNLTLTSIGNSKLSKKPVRFSVENYHGDNSKWKGFAFGAPHGDCDNETGEIVKLISENYGIPSTAAYGGRLSYRGIWYDCNRPLMKMPTEENRGVIPSRIWNKSAEEKFNEYLNNLRINSGLKYGERFELFTSFHGHDLTVKLPDGSRIQRPVIEGIGVGFTKSELRKIKSFYNRNKFSYYENPPALYFGNLPEDLNYEYNGVPLSFFYSGLGTRTYGSLRSDFVKNALHFETPNLMRTIPENQSKTAKLLFDFYTFVADSIFPLRRKKAEIPTVEEPNLTSKVFVSKGEFLMGAPEKFGWSSERPQHNVYVDGFSIDTYEVTNKQYVEFLNHALENQLIKVIEGVVVNSSEPEKHLCNTSSINPFSEINYDTDGFSVKRGREYFPVVFVSYYGAGMYAELNGERLPTEAEWEKAAGWNGSEKYLFSVGRNTCNESDANFEDSGDEFEHTFPGTSPVGYFNLKSPFGTYDMSGNVWEWCSDNYEYGYYKKMPESGWQNPIGPEHSSMKVIKGGAWNTEYIVTRNTMRLGIHPNKMLPNIGFRCVSKKGLR